MAKIVPLPVVTQPAPLLVEDAVERFLDRDWSPHTHRNFTSDLKRLRAAFAGRAVTDLPSWEIQEYLDGLTITRGDEEKPVSAATFNRHFGTLRNLFGWLERQEEIDRNPMAKVDRRKEGERLPRPMTQAQAEGLLKQIDDLRDKTLFDLLYRSGLRIAEALAINIEELNLKDGTVRIVGKGDRERIGYIADRTSKLIRRYLRERGRPRQGPLFVTREGRLTYARAYQLFQEYAGGLEDGDQPLTIHQLRHSFGSERAGRIDVLVLRDLMGHRNVRTTERYARVNPEAAKKAFRAFERERQ